MLRRLVEAARAKQTNPSETTPKRKASEGKFVAANAPVSFEPWLNT